MQWFNRLTCKESSIFLPAWLIPNGMMVSFWLTRKLADGGCFGVRIGVQIVEEWIYRYTLR